MKIRGEVEVFSVLSTGESRLVAKESNLIVDGASEIIANIMVTPSSIGGLTDSSSVLDTSNYIVQAVSLGKAAQTYYDPGRAGHYYSSYLSGEYARAYADDLPQIRVIGDGANKSVVRLHYLPSYPDPLDTNLEVSTTTQYEIDTTILNPTSATSNGQMGHNMNMFFGPSSIHDASTVFMGCYAPSDGIDVYLMNSNTAASTAAYSSETGLSGHYNAVHAVDKRGFIRGYTQAQLDSESVDIGIKTGMVVSGCNASADAAVTSSGMFIGSPAVAHTFTLSAPDVSFLNLYGGIQTLGLWTIDLEETLKNGGTSPFPFADSNGDSKRIYKLFSKKTFVESLSDIIDDGSNPGHTNHSDLYITWKICFDNRGWTT
jgi:hypothetical protein